MSERKSGRSVPIRRAIGRCALTLVCAGAFVPGQVFAARGSANVPGASASGAEQSGLRLLVLSFRHQRAAEALPTVRMLLSTQGSVALDESANTLSVRDTPAALSRVSSAARLIDHAPRGVWLDLQLIRAVSAKLSPVPPSTGIDLEILARLKQLFRYESFELLARGRISTREGEAVEYEMGDGYRLTFRPGTVLDSRRLKLDEFLMTRTRTRAHETARQELVRTVVHLRADQPLLLGLANDESAERALLLVMRYEVAPELPATATLRR